MHFLNKRLLRAHYAPIFWLVSIVSAFGQEAVVSGRIIDDASKEPIPFVTIILRHEQDSIMMGGTLSNDDGRFSLAGITKGEYTVRCSFVGYQSKTIPVLIGETNNIFDLGKIELEQVTELLDEVIIQATEEMIAAELDKKTFSMDDQFAQSGGSVLDAMKVLPGVTVDQDGKVLLRGSDKVAILIDGKQSSLTGFGNQKGLDNIPATSIKSIEIITNPSAKYDAAGMAGIINIIYKKEREIGFNGEVGLTIGLGRLTKRKEDLPTQLGSYDLNPKIIPNLNLNYRNSKINLFLQSQVFFRKHLPNNEFTTRYYDDGSGTSSQVPENRTQTQYIVNGGMDWYIDNSNTLTFSTTFDYEHHYDTAQVAYINLNDTERYRYWTWLESEVTGYLNFRLDLKHKFSEPGHELNASLQYTRGWEDEEYFLNDSSSIRISGDTTHIIATEHTVPFLLDYVKPLGSGRLEAGLKLQFRRIPVTYTTGQGEMSVIYPGLGFWSDWGENIYASYFNYIYEKKKFDVEAGIRAELTNVFYDLDPDNIYYQKNDAYDYFRFYPNIRFTWKIDEHNNLSAFYNRRVDRPGEPELRVFPKYDDPELLKVGNPYLRPQFTQTLELAYKYHWSTGSFYLSGFNRWIVDPFTRIYSIDSTDANYDVVNKIYQNVGSATNRGLELIVAQNIGDIWNISGSVNWYVNIIDEYTGTLLFPYARDFFIERSRDNTWDVKFNNQLSLPGETEVQLTFIYFAPKNIPQGRQLSRSSLDLGVKKSLLNKKGELIFSLTDMLNQYGIRQEINGDEFNATYENYYETQVLSLGFKYKF